MAIPPLARPPKDLNSFIGRKWLESLLAQITSALAPVTIVVGGGGTDAITISSGKLAGRSSPGTGDLEEIEVGAGLELTAGVLSAAGGSGASSDREQLMFMGF